MSAPTGDLHDAVARIETILHQLAADVSAPPRDGKPGGLLHRQEKIEERILRLEKLVAWAAGVATTVATAWAVFFGGPHPPNPPHP